MLAWMDCLLANLDVAVKRIDPVLYLHLSRSVGLADATQHRSVSSHNNNNDDARVLTGFCPASVPQLTLALHAISRAT